MDSPPPFAHSSPRCWRDAEMPIEPGAWIGRHLARLLGSYAKGAQKLSSGWAARVTRVHARTAYLRSYLKSPSTAILSRCVTTPLAFVANWIFESADSKLFSDWAMSGIAFM